MPLPGGRVLGSRAVEPVCGAVGVALLALVIVGGYAGAQSAAPTTSPRRSS